MVKLLQINLKYAILCPRNVEVDEINSLMCNLFPEESRIYNSADFIEGTEDGAQYPMEYLNSLSTQMAFLHLS